MKHKPEEPTGEKKYPYIAKCDDDVVLIYTNGYAIISRGIYDLELVLWRESGINESHFTPVKSGSVLTLIQE